MNLDTVFSIASLLALIGWLALLASPWAPVWSQRLAGVALPALIAAMYAALLLAFAGGASGSFSSLDGVAQLFTSRPILLAGWLHYLAFDLVVGAWEVRDARRRGVAFGWVVPCLAVTFLAGPVGFLVWLLVRAVAGRSGDAAAR